MDVRGLAELESCDSESDLLQREETGDFSVRDFSVGPLGLPAELRPSRPWRKVLTLGGLGAAAGLLVCFAFYQVAGSRSSSQSALLTARGEASISPSRFLKSNALMGVVAHHWAQNNPQCLRNGNELPAFCRTEVLQPALAEAMHSQVDRRLEQTPELRRLLNNIHMNENDQETVMGAVSHVFDPLMASIYKDAVVVMHEHAASGPDVLHQKMKEKLQPREMELRQLRGKLLPGVEGVSDASTFEPYFNEHGVGFSGETKGWSLRLDVSVADNGAAATLWPGRQLAVAPGPPGPHDSIAADVVAALDLPFSHLIVSILYKQGKLLLPKWLKIVMTIEDVIFFDPIDLIVDSILIFG